MRARWLEAMAAVPVFFAAAAAHAQSGPPVEPAQALESKWSNQADWDVPGEYVVDFRDDAEESAIQTTLTALGVAFRPTALEAETHIEIVSVDPARPGALATALAALRGDRRVENVEPLARVRASFVPDDPMYGEQWHLRQIGAEGAWTLSTGRGVTVAVVDTGIACQTVDDFKKATDLGETKCVPGYNFVDQTDRASDDQGHGTHVAGTIAQSTNNGLGVAGLAFRAKLMPVKVLSANGWGTTTDVADGIRWAADHGAQVINLSLGGPRNAWVLERAVEHARARGATVVAAAGNSGDAVGYPGGTKGVIGVAATDAKDGIAYFSSRGEGVDLAAPGVGVVQQIICDQGRNGCELFKALSGTSMASPHVAGAAALLVGLGVSEPSAVERYLTGRAEPLASDPEKKIAGAGRLHAEASVWRAWLTTQVTRAIALVAMAVIAFRLARKRGAEVRATSPGLWAGALVAGLGLFFLPFALPRHAVWVDVLSRPLCEWDLVVGANVHAFLPLANFLVPLGLTAVFGSVARARAPLAGVAIGTAGYLAATAVLGQLHTPLGWLLTTAWCAVNALASVYLASLHLRRA